jgi:hypothetical protein
MAKSPGFWSYVHADDEADAERITRLARDVSAQFEMLTFAARLLVAKRVARLLSEPVERIWSFGNEFASQLHDVDQGMRVLIERSVDEVKQNPSEKAVVCGFFDAVRVMSAKTNAGLLSVQAMIDAIGPLEKMSRDLRPVLRQLRRGLVLSVPRPPLRSLCIRHGSRCLDQEHLQASSGRL